MWRSSNVRDELQVENLEGLTGSLWKSWLLTVTGDCGSESSEEPACLVTTEMRVEGMAGNLPADRATLRQSPAQRNIPIPSAIEEGRCQSH